MYMYLRKSAHIELSLPPSLPPSLPHSLSLFLSLPLSPVRDHDEPPRGRVYYAQMTSVQFVELAQLCPDQNEVGLHLLSMAKSLAASQPPTTESKCSPVGNRATKFCNRGDRCIDRPNYTEERTEKHPARYIVLKLQLLTQSVSFYARENREANVCVGVSVFSQLVFQPTCTYICTYDSLSSAFYLATHGLPCIFVVCQKQIPHHTHTHTHV